MEFSLSQPSFFLTHTYGYTMFLLLAYIFHDLLRVAWNLTDSFKVYINILCWWYFSAQYIWCFVFSLTKRGIVSKYFLFYSPRLKLTNIVQPWQQRTVMSAPSTIYGVGSKCLLCQDMGTTVDPVFKTKEGLLTRWWYGKQQIQSHTLLKTWKWMPEFWSSWLQCSLLHSLLLSLCLRSCITR